MIRRSFIALAAALALASPALALDREKDKLFSKAGWTNTARHDAAYVETRDGLKFVLTTFTTGHARERNIIPEVAKSVMSRLRAK